MRLITACAVTGFLALSPGVGQTQPVADFYKGKTISLVIGTSPGNDYDFRGRLLARYMGRHISGEPQIVARNMPGGGGVVAANWLAAIAPRDGTTLHMIMSNMMTAQAMGVQSVMFDTRKFRWVGNTTSSPNVVNAWHTTGINDTGRGEPLPPAGSRMIGGRSWRHARPNRVRLLRWRRKPAMELPPSRSQRRWGHRRRRSSPRPCGSFSNR